MVVFLILARLTQRPPGAGFIGDPMERFDSMGN
jgi:hypothetical protein